MPNTLLLCEYATLNGGERSMLATLAAIQYAGFSLAALAPPQGPLAKTLRERGVDVVAFNTRDSAGHHRPQQELREELAGALRRRHPCLLHANSLSMGRLSGPVAAAAHVPSLAHLRDIVRLSPQAAADVNCHTRLLTVSRAAQEFHVAGGLAAHKVHVLYNGVDLDEFRPRPASGNLHRELALAPEMLLIGTIGQIALRKGQDVLAQAAAKLAGQLPHAHYVIVGERFSDKEESRRFEADLHVAVGGPLAGRFHFLGYRDDVSRLLNDLTLLVHPARQEPLGRVLLEAAAAGVAVVATDVGGTPEIFPSDSQSARLVPPGDVDALAAAIAELAADPALRCRLAAAARRRAQEAFDIRHTAAALIEHYRALL
jgi:glycosyltransferase involved in cell wall biosynthesis